MKTLILCILILVPTVNYAQSPCETFGAACCCPKPYELELDKDTTYTFALNKLYCQGDFYGHPAIAYSSLDAAYLGLYVGHMFSVNCCTSETYSIKVKNDTINISVSSQGDLCTCGACTYEVRFNDEIPLRSQYHVVVENVLDTIVRLNTGINLSKNVDKTIKYIKTNNQIKIMYNGDFNDYLDVRLYNSNGKNLYVKKLFNDEFYMDIPDNKGIYFLKIWNGIKTETIKIPIF